MEDRVIFTIAIAMGCLMFGVWGQAPSNSSTTMTPSSGNSSVSSSGNTTMTPSSGNSSLSSSGNTTMTPSSGNSSASNTTASGSSGNSTVTVPPATNSTTNGTTTGNGTTVTFSATTVYSSAPGINAGGSFSLLTTLPGMRTLNSGLLVTLVAVMLSWL
ncbi:carbohydrate-binding X8 domain-containing protein-like [Scleropages formosus]|uniref:carbohydrate-binding X8 domain-containing protein-like n=1 Tax=Scleropages formosus TaxID=113540 RepID=UPI00087827D8|nr:carbohydrate-binding X8 domain-containing protein-like [Scleropages formosus]